MSYEYKERIESETVPRLAWEIWAGTERGRGETVYKMGIQEGKVEHCPAEDGLPAMTVFSFGLTSDWRTMLAKACVKRKSAKTWAEFLERNVPLAHALVEERQKVKP